MSEIAIDVQNLSKKYLIGNTASGSLRESITNLFSKNKWSATEEFWALKDLTFDVKTGEAIGIIGKNGAGKSTLLKLLSRITEPTTGRIEINGRISSLLEVGTGFHPELTGRENIYLNGTILGMTRQEINSKFDEIVDFSGVEKFLDTPVKRYSSGMKVRLAFAVAAHLEPEILIIDEVLAVGDAEFQKKCLGKMEDVAGHGRTIFFVSHNMGAINTLCHRGILLQNGKMVYSGETDEVISRYLEQNYSGSHEGSVNFEPNFDHKITMIKASVSAESKAGNDKIQAGENVEICVEYKVKQDLVGSNLSVSLFKEGILILRNWDTDKFPEYLEKRKGGTYTAKFVIPSSFLTLGQYSVSLATGIINQGPIEVKSDCLSFEIENHYDDLSKTSNNKGKGGLVNLPITWEIRNS